MGSPLTRRSSVSHSNSQRARRLRRQTLLPPGTPLEAWPAGVPFVWDARVALARLWQVNRRVIEYPTLSDGYRWRSQPMPKAVKALAGNVGIIVGPQPNRVVIPCPYCCAEVYRLRAALDGWLLSQSQVLQRQLAARLEARPRR